MKILYVLNSGKYGGMEWHVNDLVKGMIKAGNEVYVWCPDGEMTEVFKRLGAQVFVKQIKKDIDHPYIKELVTFIKQKGIEVIHAHELKAICNALVAGNKAGVKVKISHSHTPISQWQIGKFRKKLDLFIYRRFVNKYSDAEIALTLSVKKIKIGEGIKEDKLVVIPNALDTTKYDITPNQRSEFEEEIKKRYEIPKTAFVFGTVGRLTEEKGHITLLKAFEKFLKSDFFHKRDFYLMIAGGGKLEEELKNKAKELKINDKVVIVGFFDECEKVKFYSTFDAFLFPSVAEGFGVVLIEALYMGLPTICSNLEVLKEVGNDVVDYFEKGNSHSLAQKMTGLYEKIGGEGKIISDKSKLRVEKEYSMQKFVSNYLGLYQKFLNK
ncbi:MAG: glycosyltransferase family 4 protein [Patescibacteria group bacterium]|nr:glycosyltransferase family 4 protein [Patescibacteria group bacterium]MBU1953017.1 glycosyltransferase family 4 protein [Patescibacteria group bacterium]